MKITMKKGRILVDRKIHGIGKTVEVSDEVGKQLIDRGLADPADAAAETKKSLEEMTAKELLAYAKTQALDVDAKLKKDDLLAAIRASEADTGKSDIQAESGPDTGMPEN